MADAHPKAAGVGPEAVDSAAATYSEISAENARRELAQAGLGRWAGEAKPPLVNGEVPRLPASSPWSAGNLLGTEPPLGEAINGVDPSGSQKHRGID